MVGGVGLQGWSIQGWREDKMKGGWSSVGGGRGGQNEWRVE